jgi:PAS domain S-box-containing protein
LLNQIKTENLKNTKELIFQNQNLMEFDDDNLKALINNTRDLMWSVNKDFKLITANKPFDELVKLLSGKIIEKGENVLSSGFPEEQLNRYKNYYKRAFAGESFTEIEYSNIPADFWSEISFHPIWKENEVVGTACHSRDITKQKETESNLKQSELRLKEAQSIAQLGNWEVHFKTNEALWSDEACRIYGLSPDERKQSYSSWVSFIHPEDLEYVMRVTEESKKTLSDTILNHRIVLKDGTIKHIYSKSKFELDEFGKPQGLYGITLDVTERTLAEYEREKMIIDIVQRSKSLEQFAYIISHNLRAPVSNILGLSNLLKSNVSEMERNKLVGYIYNSIEQLDGVIKDLNKILQAKSDISENKEPVYFNDLIESVKFSLANIVKTENVQILSDFSNEDHIMGVKSYLYNVFYNLILNSIKYRHPTREPRIIIKREIVKNKIRVLFEDNGIGIDLKEHREKIFGLYKRFHPIVEGKGLGLFMVKSQVEELGGSISVKSELDYGTEFTIELPI